MASQKLNARLLTVALIFILQSVLSLYAQIPTPTVSEQSNANSSPTSKPALSPSPSSTESSSSIRPEMITAIGSLWPLALIVLIIILVITLNSPIRKVAGNVADKFEKADSIELKSWPPGIALNRAAKQAAKEAVEEAKEDADKSLAKAEERAKDEPTSTSSTSSSINTDSESTPPQSEDLVGELFAAKDLSLAEEVYKRLQDSEANAVSRIKNEVLFLFVKFRLGDPDAISKLQEITEKDEAAPFAHRALAYCYEFANELDKAKCEFELAAEKTDDEERKVFDINRAAGCLFSTGHPEDAYNKILALIREVHHSKFRSQLYEALAALYQRANNQELRALALEKALESDPSNLGVLFGAAYAYGETNLHGIAILHYKAKLRFTPQDSTSLNNEGVEYNRLQMKIRAVQSYKAASELNNTLASANLANLYMGAGFVDEAKGVLDKAKRQDTVHQNIGSSISALAQKQEAESELDQKILSSAIQQQRFFRSYAEEHFVPKSNHSFADTWLFADGVEVAITQNDTSIIGEWIRDGKKGKIEGDVTNHSAKVTWHKMTYYAGDKELYYSQESEGYAYITEGGQKLEIMTLKGNEHTFIMLTRKSTTDVQHVEA